MVMHLDRPFVGQFAVTQVFANLNPMEPLGWLYRDGGVGYVEEQGAIQGRYHNGTDYGLPCGTPLVACADGTVVFAGWDTTGFGNRISVDHGDGVQTLVGHLQQIDIKVGQKVTRGQHVGLSGTTGNSTGCHTHWSVQVGDEYVSPIPYLNAPLPAPTTAAPPATADEGMAIITNHISAIKTLPEPQRPAALNSLIGDMHAKWPQFTH